MTTLPEAVPADGTALVLVLHAHLPWQLRRGTWPHGSDWLGEAVCESYLPLLDALDALARDAVPVRWTVGVTPILAQQLGAPDAPAVLRAYVDGRRAASAALRDDAARDEATRALGRWWHDHYAHCLARLEALGYDVLGALRAHADAGRVELMGSAATHAVLPLLACDESVAFQLDLGRRAHRRDFGAAPRGCWLPECGYRPAGWWQPAPWAPGARLREGIDAFVTRAGFAWTIVDAHLPRPVAAARAAAGAARARATPDVAPARAASRPPMATPRETRSPWALLAAWAEEIAEARRTGKLPPAVTTARDGDVADAVRPQRVAAAGSAGPPDDAARAVPTAGDRDAALRVARAAFDDGALAAAVRPWPVFDDLDAFLRAARAAAEGTSGAAHAGPVSRAWPWPDAAASGDAWRSGAFARESGVALDSGAFLLDSGIAPDSGAFLLQSGVALDSGAFPLESGVALDSGAFPLESGVALDSGAFPLESGVALDSGAFPLDSGIALDSGAFPLHGGAARDSGSAATAAPATAALAQAPEFDVAEARRFVEAARADDDADDARRDALAAVAFPDGWPHALHQWRGPFIGPGVVSPDTWRATLGALAPAVAHRPWRVADALDTRTPRDDALEVLVRDPVSARLVWSRQGGYPASGEYLEFHRRDDAHGLRLWRVTSHATALDTKAPYAPDAAHDAARRHAAHFAASLVALARGGAQVVVAPFDAELFGHWWREGPDFLAAVARALAAPPPNPALGGAHPVVMTTASEALAPAHRDRAPADAVLDAGSWGALGSFAMWLNARTAWLWRRLWPLEVRFWDVARATIDDPARRDALVQAARELALAQASDWPFMLTRDEAPAHAARRVTEHLDACEALLDALAGADAGAAAALAATHAARDDCFDAGDVVAALRAALAPPAPPRAA